MDVGEKVLIFGDNSGKWETLTVTTLNLKELLERKICEIDYRCAFACVRIKRKYPFYCKEVTY